MANFDQYTEGFLKKAEYTFHFPAVFHGSKKLEDLKSVVVHFEDDPIIGNRQARQDFHHFSEDGTQCKITIFFQSYYQPKGGMRYPKPSDVFDTFRRVLDHVDKEYKKKFPSGDGNID